jgi:hypothetical protein
MTPLESCIRKKMAANRGKKDKKTVLEQTLLGEVC